MAKLTRSVGRGFHCDAHDIAVLQAAFRNIQVPTPSGRRPLYAGRIDGRKSKEVEAAIDAFLAHFKLIPNGRIDPTGLPIDTLTRALPRELAGLRAFRGTTTVYVCDRSPGEVAAYIRGLRAKTPLPAPLVNSLFLVAEGLVRDFGICLRVADLGVATDGWFLLDLAFDDLHFVDPSTGRLATSRELPREAEATIAKAVATDSKWRHFNKMRFQSTMVLQCLKGAGDQPSDAQIATLDLRAKPADRLSRTFVAAAGRLLQAGGQRTFEGRKELDLLAQAAKATNPTLAQKLAHAAKPTAPSVVSQKKAIFQRKGLYWPTEFEKVTDIFDSKWVSPTQRRTSAHNGVDIRAYSGTAIFAVMGGTVVEVGATRGGANFLKIEYDDKSTGGFAHVKSPFKVGQQVFAGQHVADSDGSGTNAAHLHYTYRMPGTPYTSPDTVDPLLWQLAPFVRDTIFKHKAHKEVYFPEPEPRPVP